MNILDQYCTTWETDYKEIGGFIFCGIGITIEGDTYWKWDCGQRVENNPEDNMYDQAGKSAASDAFKRAAVQWGIGRFLYDLPTVSLPCDGYNVVDSSGNKVWDLTKHINSMKGKAPEPPKTESKLPPLPQDKLDSMLKFIAEGKIKEVEQGMKKYTLNAAQKTTLTALINSEKAKSITNATK